jgi:hypothetical protein
VKVGGSCSDLSDVGWGVNWEDVRGGRNCGCGMLYGVRIDYRNKYSVQGAYGYITRQSRTVQWAAETFFNLVCLVASAQSSARPVVSLHR